MGLRLHGAARSTAPGDELPGILYLVAGARAQERRVTALADYARKSTRPEIPAERLPEIWIGNDFEIAHWSQAHGRNLTRAEWAEIKLRDRLGDAAEGYTFRTVPGRAWGTDGEMAALAAALRRSMDTRRASPVSRRRLTLLTCPSHSRRAVSRLRAHAPDNWNIRVVTARDDWRQWMPWVTFAEWMKLGRDGLGLSSAPFLSRAWYRRESVEPAARRDRWLPILVLSVLAFPLYAWLLYPLLLRGAAARPPRDVGRRSTNDGIPIEEAHGRVAILISAYNEEIDIESRIVNLGEQDIAKDRITVYVGIDGATDATADAARSGAARVAAQGLTAHVDDFRARRGKVAVLKTLAVRALREHPDTEWLVFTDANTRFAPDAVRRLLTPFGDPRIGGVCGRLILGLPSATSSDDGDAGHATEGCYWDWENRLKTWESRLDSCLGANGAIYAVRARCFPALPDETIVDDFVIGMKIREQGYRMVYEPTAIAREPLPATRAEWRRRVRIGAGDFQALSLCRRCLLPRYRWFAWCFVSHKVLRWLTPHLLLAAWGLAAIGWIAGGGAGMPGLGYALVVAGAPLAILTARLGQRRRAIDYFIAMQAALLAGSIRWLRGGLRGVWERTTREAS